MIGLPWKHQTLIVWAARRDLLCFCFSFHGNTDSMGWIYHHGNKYPLQSTNTHQLFLTQATQTQKHSIATLFRDVSLYSYFVVNKRDHILTFQGIIYKTTERVSHHCCHPLNSNVSSVYACVRMESRGIVPLDGLHVWLLTPTILSRFSILVSYHRRSGTHYGVISALWVFSQSYLWWAWVHQLHTCVDGWKKREPLGKYKKKKRSTRISLRFSAWWVQ